MGGQNEIVVPASWTDMETDMEAQFYILFLLKVLFIGKIFVTLHGILSKVKTLSVRLLE